ncbi:MAG: response regulator [Myxococcota bacterium]
MRALVIDDSKTIRRLLSKMLADVGFNEVYEAGNGVEALDVLRKIERPHLALVDWNMPEMDGYTLIRMVRKRSDFNDMRIMMVTTETELSRVTDALEAGADEYVMKPFTRDVILEKLHLLGFGNASAAE